MRNPLQPAAMSRTKQPYLWNSFLKLAAGLLEHACCPIIPVLRPTHVRSRPPIAGDLLSARQVGIAQLPAMASLRAKDKKESAGCGRYDECEVSSRGGIQTPLYCMYVSSAEGRGIAWG